MITPEQLAASGTESGHQKAVMQWIATVGRRWIPAMDLVFSVPNGGDRSPSVAAQMKAEGVKRGVPDLVWPWHPQGIPSGLWLELKLPKHAPVPLRKGVGMLGGRDPQGRLYGGRSDPQVQWHLALRAQGWPVVTAYSWMDATWVLVQYARGELQMPDDGDCLFAFGATNPPILNETLTS